MVNQTVGKELFHPVDIGSVHIDGNLFLAPLAGYTDRSFRSVCIEHGASFTYTEMVSAEGLARESDHTEKLLVRSENETKIGVQLFMDDFSVADRCTERLMLADPTVVDVNCGCPVPKVVKTGAGSALLRHPQKIHDIVKVLKLNTSVPVSVKIRLGWEGQSINYRETADAALSAGCDMITMHARTRAMGYSGTADWEALADLKDYVMKQAPQVPVFGSGDLFTPLSARELLQQTHIDGVMFARGALGNPFIFRDTYNLLMKGEEAPFHTVQERVTVLLRQLHRMGDDIGERLACREMRKHAAAYLKGIPHASKAKQTLVTSNTFSDYESVCEVLLKETLEQL